MNIVEKIVDAGSNIYAELIALNKKMAELELEKKSELNKAIDTIIARQYFNYRNALTKEYNKKNAEVKNELLKKYGYEKEKIGYYEMFNDLYSGFCDQLKIASTVEVKSLYKAIAAFLTKKTGRNFTVKKQNLVITTYTCHYSCNERAGKRYIITDGATEVFTSEDFDVSNNNPKTRILRKPEEYNLPVHIVLSENDLINCFKFALSRSGWGFGDNEKENTSKALMYDKEFITDFAKKLPNVNFAEFNEFLINYLEIFSKGINAAAKDEENEQSDEM